MLEGIPMCVLFWRVFLFVVVGCFFVFLRELGREKRIRRIEELKVLCPPPPPPPQKEREREREKNKDIKFCMCVFLSVCLCLCPPTPLSRHSDRRVRRKKIIINIPPPKKKNPPPPHTHTHIRKQTKTRVIIFTKIDTTIVFYSFISVKAHHQTLLPIPKELLNFARG